MSHRAGVKPSSRLATSIARCLSTSSCARMKNLAKKTSLSYVPCRPWTTLASSALARSLASQNLQSRYHCSQKISKIWTCPPCRLKRGGQSKSYVTDLVASYSWWIVSWPARRAQIACCWGNWIKTKQSKALANNALTLRRLELISRRLWWLLDWWLLWSIWFWITKQRNSRLRKMTSTSSAS